VKKLEGCGQKYDKGSTRGTDGEGVAVARKAMKPGVRKRTFPPTRA